MSVLPRVATGAVRLPQRGFILVATLWALAALTLLASAINELVASDREQAERTRQALQDDLDAHGTMATVMYLLATSRMDHLGLVLEREQQLLDLDGGDRWTSGDGILKVTGQAYFGMGRVRFSLQDETAFASVNRPDPMLVATFKHVGVTDQQISWLMPRIVDYIDPNQTVMLDGAERYDYVRRDLAPPANWFMATPVELKKVLGVDDLLSSEQWRALRRIVTARVKTNYNVNTMPAAALAVLLGGDERAVRHILAMRAERPVGDMRTVVEQTGRVVPLPEDALMVPSRMFRFAVWRPGDGTRSLVGITLTPGSIFGPWRKEYSYSEPVDEDAASVVSAATPLFQST